MGTDSLTALGLGIERPHSQAMQLPPRPQSERLLNWSTAARAYLFLGVIEATAAMAAFFFVLLGGGWHYGDALAANDPLYQQATTACLSAIIVMQIVNVFLRAVRFARRSPRNPFDNSSSCGASGWKSRCSFSFPILRLATRWRAPRRFRTVFGCSSSRSRWRWWRLRSCANGSYAGA
jgi:magnesium-transporting ATPase (P-type)